MAAKKGTRPPAAGMGRRKGQQNFLTKTIKEAILVAFDKVGGADYLAEMAREQPAAFMQLLGKVLPTQLEHSGSVDLKRIIDEISNDRPPELPYIEGEVVVDD